MASSHGFKKAKQIGQGNNNSDEKEVNAEVRIRLSMKLPDRACCVILINYCPTVNASSSLRFH